MATWIITFFSPSLSHLMVLFKNMWGPTKCKNEGSLPTFDKSYRCQWEFCLSSNCSFDPRIWCMTMHFYCFCINVEKWPPCLLNHMKHLNLSSPPACSEGKKNTLSPMTAWNSSASIWKTCCGAAHVGIFLSLKFLFYDWDLEICSHLTGRDEIQYVCCIKSAEHNFICL